ncbi:ATP binding, partial [Linderina macrospora]
MKSGTTRRPFSAASRQGDEFADDGPETQYSMQQVVQWSEGRVGQWLRKQGFARHERAFMENQINGEALLELDYNLLKELSVRTVGERVRLNIAIRDLRNKCLQGDAIASARPDTSRSKARGLPSLQIINEPHTSGVSTLVGTQQMPPPPMIRGPSKELPNIPTGSPGTAQTASTLGGSNSTATSSVIRSPGLREIGAPPPTFPFGLTEPGSIKGPGNLRYRKMTAIPASQSPATKPATLDPNSPESRLRALFGGHLHSPGPPSQMNQVDTDAQEQLEEVERLNMQFQELFGTDIGVTNLADSLSLKVRQVAITGPDHVVRHISVSSTRSAHEILARILREFDLDRDVDKDRYALFVMSTDGGGARSLTDSEIVEIFNDPDSLVREKIFLRKRHQLAKPTPGARRSEQLQKAFEKLGNILPRQSSHNTISSLSAHSQTSASSSTLLGSTQMANEAGSSSMQPALSPQPTGPQPLGQSVVSLAQMQQGQTKPQNPSSIDKLQ